MTVIRATCSDCGDVETTSTEMKVLQCNQTRDWCYSFLCPACRMREARVTQPHVADILIAAGCLVIYWDLPSEISERDASFSPIAADDVIDFRKALKAKDFCLETLTQL